MSDAIKKIKAGLEQKAAVPGLRPLPLPAPARGLSPDEIVPAAVEEAAQQLMRDPPSFQTAATNQIGIARGYVANHQPGAEYSRIELAAIGLVTAADKGASGLPLARAISMFMLSNQ